MLAIKAAVSNSLKTFSIHGWSNSSYFSTCTSPLCIQLTPVVCAEPKKKKKKIDPAVLQKRTERLRRRLWKDVKRLLKLSKQLKPLDEMELPYAVVDNKEKHIRLKPILSVETLEDRADALRAWSAYKNIRAVQDFTAIDCLLRAQRKALQELKIASPRLYEEAIKIDDSLIPYTAFGVTLTPPIKDYDSPDGEYRDVTKKWDPIKLPDLPKKSKYVNRKDRQAETPS